MRNFILIISILGLYLPSFSQDTLKVVVYGVEQGLPQSSVWSMVQDNFGYLWISTSDGLCRYDGYMFHHYRNREHDSSSVATNGRMHLFKDSNGNIWIIHEKGLDLYNSFTGKFSHPLYLEEPNDLIKRFITEDTNGNIWVWFTDHGLYQFNLNGAVIKHYTPEEKTSELLKWAATDGLMDKNGTIWITGGKNEVLLFDTQTHSFKTLATHQVSSTLTMVNDSTLLLIGSDGLNKVNINSKNIRYLPVKISQYIVTSLHRDRHRIWLGTDNGVFEYNDEEEKIDRHLILRSGINKNFSYAYALLQDSSGNVWLGTNGDGLKKYNPNQLPFLHYTSNSGKAEIVKSIYTNGGDSVYVGYYDNGFDIFSKKNGFIKKIKSDKKSEGLPSDWVYTITPAWNNQLLLQCLGVYDIGLYDIRARRFKSVKRELFHATQIPPSKHNNYPVVVPLTTDTLLLNYADHLLEAVYSENQIQFNSLHQFPEVITSIYRDADHTLWVGTLEGAYFKKPNAVWQKLMSIAALHVKSFCEDAEKNIWVGTVRGVFVVNKSGQLLSSLSNDDGLSNDFIYGILRDNQDNLWFSHNKGLTRFDWRSKTMKHFSKADGLQSDEFNTGAYFKSRNGELFFGGINGTNSFFPEAITENKILPKVHITHITVADKTFEMDTVAWAKQKIVLNHNQNLISFDYVGIELTNPVKNKYRYRLVGLDDQWIEAGTNRSIRFAYLTPGDYTFEVMASNSDEVWNLQPARLAITIVPPFWATAWFRSLIFLMVISLVVGVTAFLSRQRYRRKMKDLEYEQKVQKERERLSRELHDNIGSQLTQLVTSLDEMGYDGNHPPTSKAEKMLTEINKSTRETINDLRSTIWAINKPVITMAELADKLKLFVGRLQPFNTKAIISFEESIEDFRFQPDEALDVLRICQEAVNNALLHSGGTDIKIRLASHHDGFTIVIEDNGNGFNPRLVNGDHYGLKNMEQRARQSGIHLQINTHPDKGTTITISNKSFAVLDAGLKD